MYSCRSVVSGVVLGSAIVSGDGVVSGLVFFFFSFFKEIKFSDGHWRGFKFSSCLRGCFGFTGGFLSGFNFSSDRWG